MALLKNNIFIIIICLISFVLSGIILADKVFGVNISVPVNMQGAAIENLGMSGNPTGAATKNYVDSAASKMVLPNVTSDPPGAVTGQMWIIIGQ